MGKEQITNWYGIEYDFNAVVDLMDYDTRYQLHEDIAPCDPQTFFDEYCIRHFDKYRSNFVCDTRNSQV